MYDDVFKQVSNEKFKIDIPVSEKSIPDKAGIYAIYINNNTLLPKPFSTTLIQGNSKLLYIGKAKISLRERLYEQDLFNESPSTFFRSLGAVLGYLPHISNIPRWSER